MILHLCGDDKFFNNIREIYERNFPNQNEYIVLKGKKHNKYVFDQNIRHIGYLQILLLQYRKYIEKSDIVISHGLDNSRLLILLYAKVRRKIVIWRGFGDDYYKLYLRHIELYDSMTKEIIDKISKRRITLQKIINYNKVCLYIKRLLVNRFDYFYPVIPTEYKLIRNWYPQFRLKYINLGFKRSIDFLINTNISDKKYILLGNSAAYENNHMDIFEIIEKLDLGNFKILMPISYPSNKEYEKYKARLKDISKEKKSNIEYLENFMPIDEYSKILEGCISAIMGHHRQQAAGNIYMLLFHGARIFLYEDNPLYHYLKDNLIGINTIEELKSDPVLIKTELKPSEKNINRQFVIDIYNGYKNDFELLNELNNRTKNEKNSYIH